MSVLTPARQMLAALSAGLMISLSTPGASAEPAVAVLGRDFTFPEVLPGTRAHGGRVHRGRPGEYPDH